MPTTEDEERLLEQLQLVWRPIQYVSKVLAKIERLNAQRKYVGPLVIATESEE